MLKKEMPTWVAAGFERAFDFFHDWWTLHKISKRGLATDQGPSELQRGFLLCDDAGGHL